VKGGEIVNKNFTYVLSKPVADKNVGLEIQLVSKTGQPLAWNDAHFTLTGSSTPFITVNGVSLQIGSSSTYIFPHSGPTIAKGQTINVIAGIKNPSSSSITLTPRIRVYDRIITGKPLYEKNGDSVVLAGNKTISVSNALPTFNYKPGVYVGTLDFIGSDGKVQSQLSDFRYIVGGDIATIQSIDISPEKVTAGQSVTVTVLYSGSPIDVQTLQQPKIGKGTLTISLFNEYGDLVGNSSAEIDLSVPSHSQPMSVTAQVSAEAIRASGTITKDGQTLSTFSTLIDPAYANAVRPATNSAGSTLPLVVAVAFGLLAIALIVWAVRSKNKKTLLPPLAIFFGLMLSCSILPATTHAWTFVSSSSSGPNLGWLSPQDITVNVTPSLNLVVGQQFSLAFSINAIACTNSNDIVSVATYYQGTTKTFTQENGQNTCSTENCISAVTVNGVTHYNYNVNDQIFAGTYTAPSTPGDYSVGFTVTNTWAITTGSSSGSTTGYVIIHVGSTPTGAFDNATCSIVQGWACDADNYATTLSVDLYKDGQYGTGTYISRYPAGDSRSDLVCGGTSNHAFNIATPDVDSLGHSLKDGTNHTLYAYAINAPGTGGLNKLLPGYPKTINCPAVNPTPTQLSVTCSAPSGVTSTVTGSPITYTAHPVGGNGTYTYAWTGDSTLTPSGATAQGLYSSASASAKIAQVTVTSNGVSVKSASCGVPVTAAPLTSVSCSADKTSVPVGQTVTYTALPIGIGGNYTYAWSGDGALTPILGGVKATGVYSATTSIAKIAQVTVSLGGVSIMSASCGIPVTPAPQLTVSCGYGGATVMVGGSANYTANVYGGSGTYTYSWAGDGLSAVGNSRWTGNITYSTAGQKHAVVTVVNGSNTATSLDCGANVIPINSSNWTPTLTFTAEASGIAATPNLTIGTSSPYTLKWSLSAPLAIKTNSSWWQNVLAFFGLGDKVANAQIVGTTYDLHTCTASAGSWTGNKTVDYLPAQGSEPHTSPLDPTNLSYTITCTGPWAIGSISKTVTVTVVVDVAQGSGGQCYATRASDTGLSPILSANIGESIVWRVSSSVTGNHTYLWSGNNVTGPANSPTYSMNYPTIGQKRMLLSVDGGLATECQLSSPLPVINDPNFQPF
ncbi:TPA: hypothetical protein DCQ44_03010, partial [Candidatus Taylorbacteria bacterium]|nr:hypothetical protein [Candidatus Taylorbacteria bacterium]